MIKLVIVEDTPTHQEFLESIIKPEEDIDCIAIISNAKEAIFRIPTLNPDIVLIDLGLPDIDGIDCLAQLVKLCPETKFLALTVHKDDKHIFEALKAGARGYVLKSSKPSQIIEGIRDLKNGWAPISSEIAIKLLAQIPEIKNQNIISEHSISKREKEILEYLAKGLTYDEISSELFISVNTLKSHIYRIYTKLNVDNRTEALNKYYGK